MDNVGTSKGAKLSCLLLVIFVLFCFVRVRNKDERKVVVFIIDSLQGMFNPEIFQDRLSSMSVHGKTVERVLLENGKPNNVYFYSVNDFSGGINREEYIKTLGRILAYAKRCPSHKVVVNISFGGYKHDENEQKTIEKLARRGVILVAAAGNDAREGVMYPAAFREVIAVASAEKGRKCPHSNYGPEIDIAAEGSLTLSDTITVHDVTGSNTVRRRVTMIGTSLATPRVAGIIVNVLRNSPDKDIDVKGIIKDTAKPLNDRYYASNKMGAGAVSRFSATRRVAPGFWLSEFPGIGIPFILGVILLISVLTWIEDRVCDDSHDRLESWPVNGVFLGTLLGNLTIIWTVKYTDLSIFGGWIVRLTAGPLIALGILPVLISYALKHAGHGYTLALVGTASRMKNMGVLTREMRKCRKVSDIQSRTLNGLVGCGGQACPFLAEWLVSFDSDLLRSEMKRTLKEYNSDSGLSGLLVEKLFSPSGYRGTVRYAAKAIRAVSYPGDTRSACLVNRAVLENREDIVNALVSNGFNVKEKDGKGQTPLHIAAVNGNKNMLSRLLRNGADINARDKNGHTPADLLKIHGHVGEGEESCF